MNKIFQSAIKIFHSASEFVSEITVQEKVTGLSFGSIFSILGYIAWAEVVHMLWAIITAVLAGVLSTIAIHYTKKRLNK